ncbi:MAG: MerR family transcriptional regulator [Armatimonadota bacterium]|nr:MerR family transcriptional regulator [Armatimonadota bacterium]MDR7549374.1 MerR family transcriptional regulator [Armatimonadota bacterium]
MQERRKARPVYVISVAAEITGLHPRTLRIYEERGLLNPVRRNRIRLYSDEDIERVRLIRQLIEAYRLNLAGVRLILEMYERFQVSRDGNTAVGWLIERILEQGRREQVR